MDTTEGSCNKDCKVSISVGDKAKARSGGFCRTGLIPLKTSTNSNDRLDSKESTVRKKNKTPDNRRNFHLDWVLGESKELFIFLGLEQ